MAKRWLKYLTVAEHPKIVETVRGLTKHEVARELGDTNLLSLWSRFCREMAFEEKRESVFNNPSEKTVGAFDEWCDVEC